MRKTSRLLAAAAAALAMAGCAVSQTPRSDGNYARPIGGSPVTANPTPYTDALVCLGNYARSQGRTPPRIAVGRIADYTGTVAPEGGARVTQGASLMAMSAFAKAGVNLVERFDTSVSELEMRYANNRLIGDEAEEAGFRQIYAGSIPGSDFHLIGGITELNYNIRSQGLDAFAGDRVDSSPSGLFNMRLYVMNVGVDLRLVNSRTMEVVDVISYQKQIIGREISAGVFAFFGDAVVDLSAGGRSLEPVQLAVRSVIERAVLEFSANLYGVAPAAACRFNDPLGGPTNRTGGVNVAAAANAGLEPTNVQARQNANRGHDSRDRDLRGVLRGRYD
ncbi:MAG: holdfast anchoring protein HfaB [Maricaulaceae bacterium]|nr:holdfast anchoring protein HfaB [Maricaulaceae bacterium]